MARTFTAEASFHVRRTTGPAKPGRRLAELLREQDLGDRVEPAPATPAAPASEEPPAPVVEPSEPTPPVVDRAAIDAEIEARVREARATAVAEVQAARETALSNALEAIAAALGHEAERRSTAHAADGATIARLVGAIAGTIVPKAVRSVPFADLADALEGLLHRLDEPAEIEIAVHPSLRQDLMDHLLTLDVAARFDGQLQVVADPALQLGDAIVRWPSGRAEHDLERMVAEAVTLCESWLGAASASAAPSPAPAPERTTS